MSDFDSFAIDEFSPEQFKATLDYQLEHDYLSSSEAGITRQILGQGLESLSDKQRYVFENRILPTMTELCATKGCKVPVYCGIDFCGHCQVEYGSH